MWEAQQWLSAGTRRGLQWMDLETCIYSVQLIRWRILDFSSLLWKIQTLSCGITTLINLYPWRQRDLSCQSFPVSEVGTRSAAILWPCSHYFSPLLPFPFLLLRHLSETYFLSPVHFIPLCVCIFLSTSFSDFLCLCLSVCFPISLSICSFTSSSLKSFPLLSIFFFWPYKCARSSQWK